MTRDEERQYWARATREVLKASKLTIEAFAQAMGVCGREVSYWKAAKRRPVGIIAVRFFEFRRDCISRTVVHGGEDIKPT